MKRKQLRYFFLVLLLLSLGSYPIYAAESLTVEQAVATALEHNPNLLAARQEVEVARGRQVRSRLLNRFNPSLNGQAWNRNNPGSGNESDFQVTLSQEVEVAGQRGLRREEATRNVTRVEAQVKDRERLVTGQVKRAFYQALTLKKRLGLRKEIKKLNLRIRDASKARFEAGVAPIMESNLAEIRYGQSRKETFVAEASFQNALLDLRRLLGWGPDRSFELAGQLRHSPQAVPLPDLLQNAQAQRPDLIAAKLPQLSKRSTRKKYLNSSIDPILEGSGSYSTCDAVLACETETPRLSFVSAIDTSQPARPFSVLTHTLSARGPPFLSV